MMQKGNRQENLPNNCGIFEVKNVIAESKEKSIQHGEVNSLFESTITYYSGKLRNILSQPVYRFVVVTSRRIPKESGVYLIHDDGLKQIIYAGRSRNLRTRLLQQHRKGNVRGSQFRKALGQKHNLTSETEISAYIRDNCSFQFLPVKSFEEMVRLEHFTSAILAPVLNTELKQ